MVIDTERYGLLMLSRKFDSNAIIVMQLQDNGQLEPFGEYNTQKAKKEINDFWLDLIGISERHKVLKNESFGRQKLSWRVLSSSFLISQNKVDTEKSILLPVDTRSDTAYLSSLIFLLYGDDFANAGEKETKEQRKLRQKSVSDYINMSLSNLQEDYEVAKAMLPLSAGANLHAMLPSLISDLEKIEIEINTALSNHKAAAAEIYELEENLQEDQLMLNRFDQLQSQYKSDVERLTLIVDGERLFNEHNSHSDSHNSPLCKNELAEQERTVFIEASREKLQTLASQMADLDDATRETKNYVAELMSKLESLYSQKDELNRSINKELKPTALGLKDKIDEIENFISLTKKLESLQSLQATLRSDLSAVENEPEDETPAYRPKEKFESNFYSEMSDLLDSMLRNMSYKPTEFRNAYFAKKDFDIKINGNPKEQGNGQGHTSFLNSVVVMAYRHVLFGHATYNPGVFVIDTPLLGVDERHKEEGQNSMKEGLFRYFIDHQNEGQLIIVENTTNLPDINFKENGVNEIKFTEDKDKGRYGFLPEASIRKRRYYEI